MEAIAKTKYLKGSPQKARLVIDLVRGKNVSQALAILKFTNKRAATPIAKCIHSAVANATYSAEQQNIAIDPDDLWIKTCYVDMGPTKGRRRLRPAPQGRAFQERRHYCHITVMLTSDIPEVDESEAKPKKMGKKLMAKKAADAAKKSKSKASKKAGDIKEAKPEKEEIIEKEVASEVKEETPKAEKKKATKPKEEQKSETVKESKEDKQAEEKEVDSRVEEKE